MVPSDEKRIPARFVGIPTMAALHVPFCVKATGSARMMPRLGDACRSRTHATADASVARSERRPRYW
jgi:hypothetical protein